MCLSSGRRGNRALSRPTSKVREKCPRDEVGYLAYFLKSYKVPSHQFTSKNNNPVLLFNWFKTICRHWNCFLSSVATDGKNRRWLKLKTPGPTSSFNAISGCKIPPRKLLWFKWFLMKLCYIFFTTLQEHFVYWYTLSNDFSIELIPKVAISSWPDSPFKTCDHLLKISFVVDRWTFLYWRELICKIKQING